MAELSRFFADVAGDRLTTAAQMNRVFDQLLQEKDGVIRGLGNTLAVTNAGTVSADVNTGSAVMGGRLYENTASKNLALDAVTSGSKRYDRIVVRVDETARTMLLTVIKGVEGASPAVPAIDGTTDVLLAKILLDRSSGSYVYTVTDERVYCDGLVSAAIATILNANPPTSAGITDMNAIAAATGATLYARLFGILDGTWGNGGQVPQKKALSGSVSTTDNMEATIFSMVPNDKIYLVFAYLATTNDPAAYQAYAIVSVGGSGYTRVIHQVNGTNMFITVTAGNSVQVKQTSGGSQTVYGKLQEFASA